MAKNAWRLPRNWLALLLLLVAWFGLPRLEEALQGPGVRLLHLHSIQHGALALGPFAWEMVVRFAFDCALLAAILMLLGKPVLGFPMVDSRGIHHLALGSAIGLFVMVAAILAIIACAAARVSYSAQSGWSAALHGLGWFAVDLLGAAGEEIYGRGAVLLVAVAFLGWRGALVASGAVFLVLHLGNPGASPVWLLRLFVQGVLLAYAVLRTGSLWWSVGYHTGWNWASAPLFGAAGSGYLDAGHLFDFLPTGSALVTGGAVGPEGSIFAFAAALCAAGILILTTKARSGASIAAADDGGRKERP